MDSAAHQLDQTVGPDEARSAARRQLLSDPDWHRRVIRPPRGLEEINRAYGTSSTALCSDASIDLPAPIGGVTSISCHPLAAPTLIRFFHRIHAAGLWRFIAHLTGAYVPQMMPGVFPPTEALSSWGAAVYINQRVNRDLEDPPPVMPAHTPAGEEPGEVFWPGHPIVLIARELGMTWGGSRVNYPCGSEFAVGEQVLEETGR